VPPAPSPALARVQGEGASVLQGPVLRPRPLRASAEPTIAAVLRIVGDLLDEGGEDAVRIEEVRRRSGVSSGAIYHHFGGRDGLITVTQGLRFVEILEGEARELRRSYHGVEDPSVFRASAQVRVAAAFSPEQRELRRQRLLILASAQSRPELRLRVELAVQQLLDAVEPIVRDAQRAGAHPADIDPRASALFSQTHSFGLVVDEFAPTSVSEKDWLAVLTPVLDALHRRERPDSRSVDIADLVLPPREPRGPATAAWEPPQGPAPSAAAEGPFALLLELAVQQLLAGPESDLFVAALCRQAGVTRSAFRQHFGTREGLLTAARLQLHSRTLDRRVSFLSYLFRGTSDPAVLRASLLHSMVQVEGSGSSRIIRWQRVRLLAAGLTDATLGAAMGGRIEAATDGIASAIHAAQDAGTVRPELPPRALARLFSSGWLALLLWELDGDRISPVALHGILDRVFDAVVTDGAGPAA
jgi:AcrR family transcriptional regulator